MAEHQSRMKAKHAQSIGLVRLVEAFLSAREPLPSGTVAALEESCPVPMLVGFLMSAELDMFKELESHTAAYRIIGHLCKASGDAAAVCAQPRGGTAVQHCGTGRTPGAAVYRPCR